MYLSSAYPNSALSAGALTAIVVVMAGCLVLWLAMVFLAAKSSEKRSRRAHGNPPVMARPDGAAEDQTSEADTSPGERRHGVAA